MLVLVVVVVQSRLHSARCSMWQVGYLEQEPKLDDGDTVESNIEAAVVPTRTLLKEYEKVGGRLNETRRWYCMHKTHAALRVCTYIFLGSSFENLYAFCAVLCCVWGSSVGKL